MHELGIVFYIQDIVREVAQENELTHVQEVVLELGEVSGVIPSYLTDCWQWACKKEELFQGCNLRVQQIPARTHCDACGRDYDTIAHGKTCPYCGSLDTWLLSGNEVAVKEIQGG